MESCRRTGLSGVLCSLSLLCVILDIQLDGKNCFTLEKNVCFALFLKHRHWPPPTLLLCVL